MWLHYSKEPFEFDRTRLYPQSSRGVSVYAKPFGFWFTDDSEECWRSWCQGNEFALDNLTCRSEVEIDESRVLTLGTSNEVFDFTYRYGRHDDYGYGYRSAINWAEVARDHSGLIITPYQWDCRLNNRTTWYYGWDCASGCIWDAIAILSVRLATDEERMRA